MMGLSRLIAVLFVTTYVSADFGAVSSMCENLGMELSPSSTSRMLLSQKKRARTSLDGAGVTLVGLGAPSQLDLAQEAKMQEAGFGLNAPDTIHRPFSPERLVTLKTSTAATVVPTGAWDKALEDASGTAPEDVKALEDIKASRLNHVADLVKKSTEAVLKVGICRYPPYAMLQTDGGDESVSLLEGGSGLAEPVWEGFSVSVWELIASKNNWKFEYVNMTYAENLKALDEGRIDTFAPGLFLTNNQRTKHPNWLWSTGFWLSGMGIMVRTSEPPGIFAIIFAPELWSNLGYLCIALVVAGHLYWILERDPECESMYDKDGKIIANKIPNDWVQGAILGSWWAAATMCTVGYGDYYPTKWKSRVWGTLAMVASLFAVGLWTGAITAALTAGAVGGVSGDITTLSDLAALDVAVVAGTFPAAFMGRHSSANLITAPNLHGAVELLLAGKVKAVVDLADTITYSATKGTGAGKTAMVGFPFHQHSMVFPVPPNGPGGATLSIDKITTALLEIEDSDSLDSITRETFV